MRRPSSAGFHQSSVMRTTSRGYPACPRHLTSARRLNARHRRAAAITVDNMRAAEAPCRPSKLRFAVERSGSRGLAVPVHAEAQGTASRHSKPASTRIFRPSPRPARHRRSPHDHGLDAALTFLPGARAPRAVLDRPWSRADEPRRAGVGHLVTARAQCTPRPLHGARLPSSRPFPDRTALMETHLGPCPRHYRRQLRASSFTSLSSRAVACAASPNTHGTIPSALFVDFGRPSR